MDENTAIGSSASTSPFEQIKRVNSDSGEYWSARDLSKILGYSEYARFQNTLMKAEIACENSGIDVDDHFDHTVETVVIGNRAGREVDTVLLSRYACYLVIQNADPGKEIVALGQTYFAVQTHRQELADEQLSPEEQEAQRRLVLRGKIKHQNTELASAAKNAGVIQPTDFAVFQNHGYKGLYNGLDADAIHKRKGLKKSQHILDHMGTEELAANLFRSTQAEAKLRRDQVQGKDAANKVHYEAGQVVRKAIAELGGTMPESLPTVESLKKLERKQKKLLPAGSKRSEPNADQVN